MTTTETGTEATDSPRWLTIGEAADLLGVSAKTVRRKIKSGDLVAEMRHDSDIGSERWYIDAEKLPRQPGTASVVSVEVLATIDALHRELTAATARAEVAETVAEFQAERRRELEAELERLRSRRWWQRR